MSERSDHDITALLCESSSNPWFRHAPMPLGPQPPNKQTPDFVLSIAVPLDGSGKRETSRLETAR